MSRGKWTKETRESHAQKALAEAKEAAQKADVKPELPMETTVNVDPIEKEPEGNEFVAKPPRNEPRRRAFEEIEARDIQSKTSLGIELGLDENEKPKLVQKQEIPPDPAPPTAEEMLHGGKFSGTMVRVKVDGEEFDVPQTEIDEAGGVKAYQIQRAADNRLRKANEALAEIRRLQGSKPETSKQPQEDFIKSKIDVLRWGTPEESAQAFKEILEKQAKPIDHNMIVEMAADRIRHDDAVKKFDDEFKDIGASPMHLKLVMALRAEALNKGHPGDWNHFYRSLGNQVRSVMPRQSQPDATKPTPDATSPASVREERKSSIVNLPQTSVKAQVPEEPKTETRQDILNQMRKMRGFPTG